MESVLYKSIFAKGEAQGEAKGKARGEARGEAKGEAKIYASTINKLLLRWLGSVDSDTQRRLAMFPDRGILAAWYDEALGLSDAESARKLLEKIEHSSVPVDDCTPGAWAGRSF